MVVVTNRIPCQVITNHPAAEGKPISWKASYEKISPDILLVRNALPKLDELMVLVEKHADLFSPSSVIDKNLETTQDVGQRQSDGLVLGNSETTPEALVFYGLMCQSMEGTYISTYLREVNDRAIVQVGSGYNLLRYREGGYFREHVDVTRDHPVLGHRRLSAVYFCNGDFEGGELVFPRQDLVIKPEQGMMVMFPSNFTHPHESTTITRGTKYAIVSWYF